MKFARALFNNTLLMKMVKNNKYADHFLNREGFEFQAVKSDSDLPVLEMRIDTNKEMIAGK